MNNILRQEEINRINDLCNQYGIKGYSINSDGSIDVDAHVNLSKKELFRIPIKFNRVGGDFYCNDNGLTSLEGCPDTVGGDFVCNDNGLTSLEGCPDTVGGDFVCNDNQLTSLKGCPKFVGGAFYCSYNDLTSLEFSPKEVGGHFFCYYNNLPYHFIELYNKLKSEEIKIFVKYHHHMRIWDDGYDQGAAQDLFDDIKDGLL